MCSCMLIILKIVFRTAQNLEACAVDQIDKNLWEYPN